MDDLSGAVRLLPTDMRKLISAGSAEEIRLRVGFKPSLLIKGSEQEIEDSRAVTSEDLDSVLERATGASVHAAENSIKNGFVTVRGGIRLGLCGEVVIKQDMPCGIRCLSSVSIRIPREVRDCCDDTYKILTEYGFQNTLILSPPGGGKTTYLRELIRRVSDSGQRVCLADERGEVAAVWNGQAQFNVGRCTDIMSDAPKGQATEMMLRAMNPQILAMDEITAPADIQAALETMGCGVKLLATAHAGGAEDFTKRPLYRPLLECRAFRRAVVIENIGGARHYRVEELP